MTHGRSKIETRAIHAGEPRPRIGGAVSMPIFQSANFEYTGEATYDAIRYLRLNNTPSQVALHEIAAYMLDDNGTLMAVSQPVSLPVQ